MRLIKQEKQVCDGIESVKNAELNLATDATTQGSGKSGATQSGPTHPRSGLGVVATDSATILRQLILRRRTEAVIFQQLKASCLESFASVPLVSAYGVPNRWANQNQKQNQNQYQKK